MKLKKQFALIIAMLLLPLVAVHAVDGTFTANTVGGNDMTNFIVNHGFEDGIQKATNPNG